MESTNPTAFPRPSHEMNGPTLSRASAVEANTPFQRSHSTPDLLALTDPNPSTGSLSRDSRSFSLNHLPNLPKPDPLSPDPSSYDFLSLDFDFDHDFQASFLDQKSGSVDHSADHLSGVERAPLGDAATPKELHQGPGPDNSPSRRKSMIDKPRLWLSRSDVGESIPSDGPGKPTIDDAVAPGGDVRSGREPRPLERSRTFAGITKKPWAVASRSPSPPRKSDRSHCSDDQALSSGNWHPGAAALGAASFVAPQAPTAPTAPTARRASEPCAELGLEQETSRSSDALSSTSRAFSRAGVYFSKIRQRPQSVFARVTLPSSSFSSSSSSAAAAVTADSGNSISSSTLPRLSPPVAPTTTSSCGSSLLPLTTPSTVDNPSNNINSNPLLHPNGISFYPRSSSQTASSCASETDSSSEDASQSTADTSLTMPHPTSRDPLWATFRNLETDFNRFAAKNSAAAKMAAVRSTLIPFLHKTLHHPSNADKRTLTPEDVDRRATILGKWWQGLLQLLDSGQSRSDLGMPDAASFPASQSASAADRPAVLDATAMIMVRPEWRLSTSHFQPLADRSPFERVRARSETDSTESNNSDVDSTNFAFVFESAEHNVRTTFVTRLLTQMAIVVDKMSMRHAPLSLVSWSGKACAYAFFFAPGVADVLVRLWGLKADLIRRVADEVGLPRRSNGESEDIVALFPSNLGGLGWTSVKTTSDRLRLAAKLPLLAAKIPWHGPWVSRWRGGDTDLLFAFCKHYYVLAEEFMPPGLPLVEKARAPAFILLHAQLLTTLDNTIHRQAAVEAMLGPPLVDASHGVDASISTLSLPPNNLLRGMDENRMVILLKGMLFDPSLGTTPGGAKLTFAEAFMRLLKAATKRTSRYEHASCFTLCDLLEEALAVYASFENSLSGNDPSLPPTSGRGRVSLVDWPFWFDVAKLILNSNNTMAEIRMLSFLFTMWDSIAADPVRKEDACVNWLLSEEVFDKFFNNWCPMVRAYYMRLLCWRICRDFGSANELDVKIFLLVSQRLKTVWSHYLWLKQTADAAGRLSPSTAPCYPAPGKRFTIVRTEVQPPQTGLFASSERDPPAFPGAESADYRNARAGLGDRAPSSPTTSAGGSSSDDGPVSYKKKWTLLGKVLSLAGGTSSGTNGGGGSGSNAAKRDWDDELEGARRETATSRMVRAGVQFLSGPPPPPKQESPALARPSSDSGSSTGSSPVFDSMRYIFRFTLNWQSQAALAAGPPRDRILTRPRLPAPAQARVSARSVAIVDRGASDAIMFRSDSPPPIAAGLPLPTRRVSGVAHTGLISEARNARPLENDLPPKNRRRSATLGLRGLGSGSCSNETIARSGSRDGEDNIPPRPSLSAGGESSRKGPKLTLNFDISDPGLDRARPAPATITTVTADIDAEIERQRNIVQPTKPMGIFAAGATYSGRALAEWSLVVNECNSFVDRRRDEGALGLREVEVPTLGVEGLGMRR